MSTTASKPLMNRQQKILCFTQLPLFVIAVIYTFSPKNFLPDAQVARVSVFLSAALAVGVSVWAASHVRRGTLDPQSVWKSYGRTRKCLLVIGMPLLLWGVNHLSFAYALPRLWTMIHSEPRVISYEVSRYRGGGRYSCTYQIQSDQLDPLYFELCVPKTFWNQLPDQPFVATFRVDQSSLGMTFEETWVE